MTLAECQEYHQAFPLIAALEESHASQHLRGVKDLIEQNRGKSVRYCLSYTISPQARESKEFSAYLKSVLAGIFPNFMRDSQTDLSLLCGVVKFKADQMFESWGYEPLQCDNKVLPPYFHSFVETEARAFYLRKFSDYAMSMAEKFSDLWDTRIQIDLESSGDSLQKAV